MKRIYNFSRISSFLLLATLVIALFVPTKVLFADNQGQGDCEAGYVFKDEDGSDGFTYEGDTVITRVIIKAGSAQSTDGNQCTEFTEDGENGCYEVEGLGTTSVTVTKIGDGPDCKDISHASFYADSEEEPTPTPTPTPTPEPTPTPTPTPEPTPTPTPEESDETSDPTPTPTPEPTPTPTPTPTQSSGNDGGTSNSSSTSSSNSTPSASPTPGGDVLGATTYAETGTAAETIISLIGLLGLIATGTGITFVAKHGRLSVR